MNPLDPEQDSTPEAWEKFWEDQFIWDEIWWTEPKELKAIGAIRRKRKPHDESDEDEDKSQWDEDDDWEPSEPDDLSVLGPDGEELEPVNAEDLEITDYKDSGAAEDSNEIVIDLGDDQMEPPPEDMDTGRDIQWWDPESIEVVDHRKVFVSKDAKGRVIQRFPTARDFLKYVNDPLPKDVNPGQAIHLRNTGYWKTEGGSWEDANRLAREGWPEGVAAVKKLNEKLKAVVVGLIPDVKVKHQETGEQLDIGRFLEGDPDMFMTMVDEGVREEKRKPSIIRMVTTFDTTWSREAFIMRGAACLAVCDLLERHGYMVQIDAHIGSNNVVDTWIRIKNTDDRVSLEKSVFWTGHPLMFSRMAYAAWCHMDKVDRDRAGGLATKAYGWISEPPADDRGDVYISALNSSWCMREETTLNWVKETLRLQGVEVGE